MTDPIRQRWLAEQIDRLPPLSRESAEQLQDICTRIRERIDAEQHQEKSA